MKTLDEAMSMLMEEQLFDDAQIRYRDLCQDIQDSDSVEKFLSDVAIQMGCEWLFETTTRAISDAERLEFLALLKCAFGNGLCVGMEMEK